MAEEEKLPATCKFCGAKDPNLIGQDWYDCGTHFSDTTDMQRGKECLCNEIASLVRQRVRLRETIEWFLAHEDYTFAEGTLAEEAICRFKMAIAEIEKEGA